ncbi:MAG: iron-containing alcohol dehydrogenase, partial [Candidatus Omnitrophica bacterium]|nr:iron-containing alcohol dehydrogenase [Candidatus Omnitrophota bacterium]
MMNTLPNTQFSIPTTVRFGAGEIKKIRTFLDLVGSKNPLLMTDPGMVNTPAFKKILAPLRDGSSDYGLFGDVLPNPTEDN